jgi:hypothetical protein
MGTPYKNQTSEKRYKVPTKALPPMRDFASLILGKYCTFVCEFVRADKAQLRISFIRPNKLPHTKVQYLPSIREAKSRNLLSHNGTVINLGPLGY